ncbi:hypothetical protein [uncultured Maricaulis sp.]|uniref:hypothetical protein n=1 Tax=uncultured Maricaulis sp. TaxID=174710 RepID=UPI00262253F3|nr:hypothetical protein [uncultured Maricaulis sp.]
MTAHESEAVMRFLGIILSLLILAGTGVLVWQDGLRGDELVVRPAPAIDSSDPTRSRA